VLQAKSNLQDSENKDYITGSRATSNISLSIVEVEESIGVVAKYNFSNSANLSLIYKGQTITVVGCTNSENDGDFKVNHVNDELGNKYLVVFNSIAVNETCPTTALIHLDFEIKQLHGLVQDTTSLAPSGYDYIALTRVAAGAATGEIETITYKTGGVSGKTLRVVTLGYDINGYMISVGVV